MNFIHEKRELQVGKLYSVSTLLEFTIAHTAVILCCTLIFHYYAGHSINVSQIKLILR